MCTSCAALANGEGKIGGAGLYLTPAQAGAAAAAGMGLLPSRDMSGVAGFDTGSTAVPAPARPTLTAVKPSTSNSAGTLPVPDAALAPYSHSAALSQGQESSTSASRGGVLGFWEGPVLWGAPRALCMGTIASRRSAHSVRWRSS